MTSAAPKDPNRMTRDQRRHLVRRLRAAWLAQQKQAEDDGPAPRDVRDAIKKIEAWHQTAATKRKARLRALEDHHTVAFELVMFGPANVALEAVKAFERGIPPIKARKA